MTGGWTPTIGNTSYGNYEKASEYLRLYATKGQYVGNFDTAKTIDFTGMKTLKVTYSHDYSNDGSYPSITIDGNAKYSISQHNTVTTVSFSVSDLSGKHTVGFSLGVGGNAGGSFATTATINLRVYKIELSAE